MYRTNHWKRPSVETNVIRKCFPFVIMRQNNIDGIRLYARHRLTRRHQWLMVCGENRFEKQNRISIWRRVAQGRQWNGETSREQYLRWRPTARRLVTCGLVLYILTHIILTFWREHVVPGTRCTGSTSYREHVVPGSSCTQYAVLRGQRHLSGWKFRFGTLTLLSRYFRSLAF